MNTKTDTVEVVGKNFLKCWEQNCEWNIDWLSGYNWIEEPGKGATMCNLRAKALILAKAVLLDDCPQSSLVLQWDRAELEL